MAFIIFPFHHFNSSISVILLRGVQNNFDPWEQETVIKMLLCCTFRYRILWLGVEQKEKENFYAGKVLWINIFLFLDTEAHTAEDKKRVLKLDF